MDDVDGLLGVEAALCGCGGVDGFGDAGGEVGCQVIDYGAQTAVEFDFGVKHVFDDFGEEAAAHYSPQVARVKETAAFAEFPEGVSYAGEVEGDLWGDVFDVEGYNLLF